jgi:hypothetical protein
VGSAACYRAHRVIRFRGTVRYTGRYTGRRDCRPVGCFAQVRVADRHGQLVWDSLPPGAGECVLIRSHLRPCQVLHTVLRCNQRRNRPAGCALDAGGRPDVPPGRYTAVGSYSLGISAQHHLRIRR